MHLYRYSGTVAMDGKPLEIRPGYGGFTPPGAEMRYRFPSRAVHVFAHLLWPTDAGPKVALPYMFPVGPTFPILWDRLEEAVTWQVVDPVRADVRAWDVLLSMAEVAGQPMGSGELPRPVRQALHIIELRLEEALSVEAIAREVGISHNHLSRLFRASTGDTIIGTIQKRRVDRARHLLGFTTLPVKEIATLVGLPDLQQFNKTVRKVTGMSPSRLREVTQRPD